MPSHAHCAWALVLAVLAVTGCGQNPFLSPQPQAGAPSQQAPYVSQVQELQRRVAELDTSNRDLNTQLAQAEQQMKIYRDQSDLLRKQLADTARQCQQAQVAQQEASKRVEALQASVRKGGGAIITANNSIRRSLAVVDIPGLEIRQQEDVIRIECPADQLFQRGSAQLLPSAAPILDKVADAIARNYPRQRVAIEGHTDSGPVYSGVAATSHQLSTYQALAVFDLLTRRDHLPAKQLFIQGMGSNYPRASNATEAGRARNRRIELVIYPETID